MCVQFEMRDVVQVWVEVCHVKHFLQALEPLHYLAISLLALQHLIICV
jgi:hypothetical protein